MLACFFSRPKAMVQVSKNFGWASSNNRIRMRNVICPGDFDGNRRLVRRFSMGKGDIFF